MKLLHADWPLSHVLNVVTTLRSGGHSGAHCAAADGSGGMNLALHVADDSQIVLRNRAVLNQVLPAAPCWLEQVHGVQVIDADEPLHFNGEPPCADGAVSSQPGRVLAVLTADCLPIVIAAAPDARVFAVLHAGWRGLAAGVIQTGMAALRAKAQDAGLKHDRWCAWIGPGIGPDHFEVGNDMRDACRAALPEVPQAWRAVAARPGKWLADLPALARASLRAAGVEEVYACGLCTVGHPKDFYSHRRDAPTGRMATLAWRAPA